MAIVGGENKDNVGLIEYDRRLEGLYKDAWDDNTCKKVGGGGGDKQYQLSLLPKIANRSQIGAVKNIQAQYRPIGKKLLTVREKKINV